MKNSLTEALEDLDEVIGRLRDAGASVAALERERLRLTPPERPSYPPAAHERTREHFRKAREYTSEALRRLQRD